MKTNPALRVFAFILCILTASAAFWSMVFSLRYWDEMWTDTDYYSSTSFWEESENMSWQVRRLAELRGRDDLTYTQRVSLSTVRANLDPGETNYRYELRRDDTGELVESNLDGQRLEDAASGLQTEVFTITDGDALHERDVVEDRPLGEVVPSELEPGVEYLTDDGVEYYTQVLRVWTGDKYVEFPSGVNLGYNEYGWYNDGYGTWSYDYDRDSRITYTGYALRSGVANGLPVDDGFRTGRAAYIQWRDRLPMIGILCLASGAVALLTLVFLCFAAGHRQGVEGIALTWADRVPLELLACAAFGVVMLAMMLCADIYRGLTAAMLPYRVVGLMSISATAAAGVVGFVLTTAARLKAHTLLDTCLLWHFCRWCWRLVCRFCRAVVEAVKCVGRTLSMDVRLGIAFLVYLAINAFLAAGLFQSSETGFFLIGLVLFNGGAFWLGCRWIEQWRRIRVETGRVLGGDTTAQIDTARMYPDLKQHAEQLNDLGASINQAVDERLKSEHFKAELITNVSHDLKTPLTSIINYVDLLKKEPIDNPKAREYIEVLDRKSQRLKKLTEDLVEASKASTGNLTVSWERLDLCQLTDQALGEYSERLEAQGLTVVRSLPEEPVWVEADGRHLWRVLENLLSNCAKYALAGTRVYIDLHRDGDWAVLSVKNISRDALDIPAERLMERFVQGDESRNASGSGLGLSIAQSLTELQRGQFKISIDGDLFKAIVTLPLLYEEPNGLIGFLP